MLSYDTSQKMSIKRAIDLRSHFRGNDRNDIVYRENDRNNIYPAFHMCTGRMK